MIIYLAAPYTGTQSEMISRYHKVNCVTAKLMQQGYAVYSPITIGHVAASYMPKDLRTDSDYWMRFVDQSLPACSAMVVLKLDGWKESRGVQYEIDLADKHDIPVIFTSYENRDDIVVFPKA